jgi:hypothetical protein
MIENIRDRMRVCDTVRNDYWPSNGWFTCRRHALGKQVVKVINKWTWQQISMRGVVLRRNKFHRRFDEHKLHKKHGHEGHKGGRQVRTLLSTPSTSSFYSSSSSAQYWQHEHPWNVEWYNHETWRIQSVPLYSVAYWALHKFRWLFFVLTLTGW